MDDDDERYMPSSHSAAHHYRAELADLLSDDDAFRDIVDTLPAELPHKLLLQLWGQSRGVYPRDAPLDRTWLRTRRGRREPP